MLEQINKPKTDWILKGLRRGSVGFLIAPPDSGKSYVALSIAYELATGLDLLGVNGNPLKPKRTLYWPVEDGCENASSRIIKHFDDIHDSHVDNIIDRVNLRDSSEPIGFSRKATNTAEESKAREEIDRLIEDCRDYDLLIIDTIREAMGSADEVEDDMAINRILKEVAKKGDVAIIAIHHPTKATARGQDAISSVSGSGLSYTAANSRLHFYIKADQKSPDKKTLMHTKANFIVNKDDKINAPILWTSNNLPFVRRDGLSELLSNAKDRTEYKPVLEDVRITKRVDSSPKYEVREPLVIDPDESKLTEESKRRATENSNQVITDEMREKLRAHREKGGSRRSKS